jgi:hypothetical protein
MLGVEHPDLPAVVYGKDGDQFFTRCIDWLTAHADLFDIVNPEHEDWKSGAKAFGELIFLLMLLLRSGHAGRSDVRELARRASVTVQAFDWEAALSFYPNLALVIGYVVRFCRLVDAPPPLAATTLAHLRSSGYTDSVDYKPFRRADLLYGFGLAGLPIDREQLAATLRRTALLKSGESTLFSFYEMYAVTHAVFYLTDFGFARPQLYASDEEIARVRIAVTRGLGVACRERHLDLIAEYLICWAGLDMPLDPICSSARAMLLANQRADGAVPAFANRTVYADRTDVSPRFAQWLECYHTTLVSALASTRLGDARV